MKKYFMAETGEELQFGDIISLTLHKDLKGGFSEIEKEIEFTEGMVDILLGLGIIEEEEEDGLIDFDDNNEALNDLIEDFEVLEKRVEKLEDKVGALSDILQELRTIMKNTTAKESKKSSKIK